MNTIIEKDFDFQACVHFQDTFLMNIYEFTLIIEVNTDNIREQNVAMDRIKYLVYESIENSIFVNFTDTKAIENYTKAGLKVCVVPEEPYDQIIALLLLLKLNAICENKLKIIDIKITSKLSDDVKFNENIDTATNAITTAGWWNEIHPNLCSSSQNKKEKIVKLVKDSWNELGLGWKEKKVKSAEIVFTTHPKNKP